MKKSGERMTPEFYRGELIYGEHLLRYQACLPVVKGKTVLDCSSGSGYGTQLLATAAKQVTGVDIDKEAVEYARKHFAAKNAEFTVGDAEKLPLKEASVEVVVSFETVEHLKHPEKFLIQVKRVLQTGGVLIISTPNKAEYPSGNEFHLHEFNEKEFAVLLRKHFAHVSVVAQRNWFATSMGEATEVTFESDPSLKHADYFVAVCSDAKLPKLAGGVIIAQRFDAKSQQEENDRRIKQIDDYEARVLDYENRLAEYEQRVKRLQKRLERFNNNPAIKLAKAARRAVRGR